jgi:hypothetical protein
MIWIGSILKIISRVVKIIDLSQLVKKTGNQTMILLKFGKHDRTSPGAAIKYQIKG